LRHDVMIDATLHAYFTSRDVDAAVSDYSTMMQSLIDIAMLRVIADRQSLRPFGLTRREQAEAIVDLMPADHNGWRQCPACGVAWLKLGVLRQERAFIRTVLNAHALGYSTTTRDLIDNLLPF
jgi:hypothetical protein